MWYNTLTAYIVHNPLRGRCVWSGLELNSAGKWISRAIVAQPCPTLWILSTLWISSIHFYLRNQLIFINATSLVSRCSTWSVGDLFTLRFSNLSGLLCSNQNIQEPLSDNNLPFIYCAFLCLKGQWLR